MITITVDDETFAMRCKVTFLSKDYSLIRLKCGDILYFEYFDRKIRIVTQERDYICINEQIGDIAGRMKPYGFCMCHQLPQPLAHLCSRLSVPLAFRHDLSGSMTMRTGD